MAVSWYFLIGSLYIEQSLIACKQFSHCSWHSFNGALQFEYLYLPNEPAVFCNLINSDRTVCLEQFLKDFKYLLDNSLLLCKITYESNKLLEKTIYKLISMDKANFKFLYSKMRIVV